MIPFLLALASTAIIVGLLKSTEHIWLNEGKGDTDGQNTSPSVQSSKSTFEESQSEDPERAYEKWTPEEEEKLVVWNAKGVTEEEIADRLRRSKSAVRSRINQAKSSFWTPSRTRKLSKSAQSYSEVSEVAENLEIPEALVEERMRDIGLIGNSDLADLRDRLSESKVKVRFWKVEDGEAKGATPSNCDAAWVPSKRFDTSDHDLFLFSQKDASTLSKLLVQLLGFDGEVSRSNSRETWNIWNVSRHLFKQKVKRNDGGKAREERSKRRKSSRQVGDVQRSRYMGKHPELKDMDYPDHWIRLSEQLMIDPGVLKSNLD